MAWCALAPRAEAGFSGTDLFLPSIGRGPGAALSQWYTTAWIHNPSPSTATVQVMFLERKKPNPAPLTVTVLVPAGDTIRYANVLAELFSSDNSFGALRFVSDQKIVVACRVFNLPAGGTDRDTQGQDYAGIPASFGISKGQSTQLLGVYQTSTDKGVSPFRYSFGFAESAGGTANVHVTAYDQTGAKVAEKDYGPLGPYEVEYYPIEDISAAIASTNLRLTVSMTDGTGKVIAVGSGVANQSNDATTFEMRFADTLLGGSGLNAVSHDSTLTGDGTTATPLGIANGAVVRSLNGLKDNVTLSAGPNVTITPSGNTLTIAAASTGGGIPSVNGITSAVTINGTGATTVSTAASTITVNSPASLPPGGPAGGDLTGTYPSPMLRLPYSGATSGGTGFSVTNTGSGRGLSASCGDGIGVYGFGGGTGTGVFGVSNNGNGVYGGSTSANGVKGESTGGSGTAGVFAVGTGANSTGVAAYAVSPAHLAGYFSGDVSVTGTLSKGGGSFKIDHPLDPEHKYLYHSFVESPDMKDIYDGVVTTDANGDAVVELPAWFEALNRDFRYQLTVIGRFAQAIVSQEVEHNRFAIKTNLANVKVSWQVTGIRKDPFANTHRIPIEEDKPALEQGSYLHPAEYGQPEEKGVDWARNPEMMRRMKEERAAIEQKIPTK